MRTRVLATVVGIAAAACARKEPAPAASQPPPQASPVASGSPAPRTHQPHVVRKLAPIAEAEAAGLLLAPAGARVVRPVAHAAIGERIEGRWCIAAGAGTLAELGAALARQYGDAGWSDFALHPNPNLPGASLSAVKAPYALFGSLAPGTPPECAGTQLSLGVHRVEAVPSDPRAPVGPSGTSGLRVR